MLAHRQRLVFCYKLMKRVKGLSLEQEAERGARKILLLWLSVIEYIDCATLMRSDSRIQSKNRQQAWLLNLLFLSSNI